MKSGNSIVCVIVAIIIVLVLCVSISAQSNTNTYTATVTDKVVKRYDKNSDKYLICTKLNNGETRVFEDTDSVLRGKFNSSDVYAQIQVGKTYEFKVYGYRNGFMSWYENIYEIREVINK